MKPTTKYVLIGLGIAAAITAVGFTLHIRKKNKDKRDAEKAEKDIAGGGKDADKGTDKQTKGDIGKKVNVEPALGYTNVRSSAKVDDGTLGSWFGVRLTDGNFIGKAESNPVGVITEALTGEDGYTWYKVKLAKPLGGKQIGYVRQDAVSF